MKSGSSFLQGDTSPGCTSDENSVRCQSAFHIRDSLGRQGRPSCCRSVICAASLSAMLAPTNRCRCCRKCRPNTLRVR